MTIRLMKLLARVAALFLSCANAARAAQPDAAGLSKVTGVDAGLIVHVGTAEGQFEAELAKNGRMLVHGLALDEKTLQAARTEIAKAGVYGLAAVDLWRERGRLPYADNLVNLLVVDLDIVGKEGLDEDEILRVLAPGRGVAWVGRGGQWSALRKPMGDGLDGWEQLFYDATGNSLSRDRQAKPGTGIQWIAGSQETADDNGYRFSGGKLVYKRRVGSQKQGGGAHLICRDAFNGLPYWVLDTTPTKPGVAPLMGKLSPLVFSDGRVYTALQAKDGPLVAIEAATGKQERTYESAGLTFTSANPRGEVFKQAGFRGGNFGKGDLTFHKGLLLHAIGNEFFVVEAATGHRRWTHTADAYRLLQKPVVNPDDNEVYLLGCNKEADRSLGGGRNPGQRAAAVLAFDLATGKPKWTLAIDDRHVTHFVYGRRTLVAYSAQDNGPKPEEWIFGAIDTPTGKFRWRHEWNKEKPLWNMQRREPVIRDDKLYLMSHGVSVFDLQTGKREFDYAGGNTRCETSKATTDYLMMAFGQFVDLNAETPRAMRVGISRGSCGSGFFPAYGMVHYLPNMCHCDNWVRFHVTTSAEPVREPIPDDKRLVTTAPAPAAPRQGGQDEWPTFLGGPMRNGWSKTSIPAELAPAWSTPVQAPASPEGALTADWLDTNDYIGPASAPVVAGGLVVVSVREQHRIDALDAATGQRRWSFTAGGRVVTPPTISGGLCLFGCRDGWVYALRADSGELAWKFLAAPYERNLVAFGQVESSWPILGSILVHNDLAYVVAGYHPLTNGGLFLWALEPATGKVRWKRAIERKPEWVDLTQPKVKLDKPTDSTVPIGGFLANVVVNNVAYGDGEYVRFSGATLKAASGEVVPQPAANKGFAGLYDMTPWPMRFLLNTDKYPQWRRHYFTEGYGGPYGGFSNMQVTLPGTNQRLTCTAFAFDGGHDAVLLRTVAKELSVARYDARKLVDRAAANSAESATWATPPDGPLVGRPKGTTLYDYASLIVAGDAVLAGGRLRATSGDQTAPADARKVARGALKVFDLATGKLRQTVELDAAPVVSGIAAAGGKVYVTCEDGSVRCLGGM